MSSLALGRAVLVLLACVSTAMIAPDARAASDADVITTCLQTEASGGRNYHACVGRLTGSCVGNPPTQSDLEMAECARRETAVWDDILNDEYKHLMDVLKGKAADSVRQAQRLWVEMRDIDCRVPVEMAQGVAASEGDEVPEGGTSARLDANQCMLDHTADRAIQMRDWRETAQAN
jgi:uncharacterized protein YecT (DUF1311 family)